MCTFMQKVVKNNPDMVWTGIRTQCSAIWNVLCTNKILVCISCLVVIEIIIFYIVNGIPDDHYSAYVETTQNQYPNQFTFIFCENLKSVVAMIFVGAIPLYLGGLYGTMMSLSGLVLTFKYLLQRLPFHAIFLSILPHGVLEMTALLLSFILSNILSKEITIGLWQHITGRKISFWGRPIPLIGIKRAGKMILSSIAFVIVPLLFLAAAIEVTISPAILSALV